MKTAIFILTGCTIWPASPVAWGQARTQTASSRKVVVSPGGSYLGVGVADIDTERAKALNLKEERGVEVKHVDEDSPAAKAGIREGDVIVEFNGQPVEETAQFMRLVRETPVGRSTKILLSRNGASQTVTASIGKRKGPYAWLSGDGDIELFGDMAPPAPPVSPSWPSPPALPDLPRSLMMWNSPVLGIESESLGSQLAAYFGVKEGVLVRSVMKDSAAEKAGLKAGDVIVKVDGTSVTSPREISSLLRSVRSRKTIPLLIMRNQKELTLRVTLNERSEWKESEDRATL